MIIDKNLEKYLLEHSSPEDPVLADLYRQTYTRFVNPNRVTGHLQGKLLEFISRMINPEFILEIGTFTGYSAICLAKGLKPGGRLFTIEINDEMNEFSHSYFCKAGLESKIVQLTGKAQEIIPGLDLQFDLAYIDGDKREYTEYYEITLPKLRSGGIIIADNVLWGDKVLDINPKDPQTRGIIEFNEIVMKDKKVEKVMLPVRDGIMLIRKLQ